MSWFKETLNYITRTLKITVPRRGTELRPTTTEATEKTGGFFRAKGSEAEGQAYGTELGTRCSNTPSHLWGGGQKARFQ